MMEIYTYGSRQADMVLLQMTDDHDQGMMEQEISYIKELTSGMDFQMITCRVDHWNQDLSPWPAPPVFSDEAFGSGAADTLDFLIGHMIPGTGGHRILGGYSLAGLFALWAAYQTDLLEGIAAASPSVWFPGFVPYARTHSLHTKAVYLSLGDREEKTRSAAMSTVGDAVRELGAWYAQQENVRAVLEWNKGNHFKEPDLRTAKAFAWTMKAICEK